MNHTERQIPKDIILGREPQREGDVNASLQELEKSISILQDAISILLGRLNPIIRNEPTDEERLPESPNRCELSGVIRYSAIRVTSINKDIRAVIGLLEI